MDALYILQRDNTILLGIDNDIYNNNIDEYIIDEIIYELIQSSDSFDKKENEIQYLCGVIKHDSPLFYKVYFINEKNQYPILLGLQEISIDDYLDSINKNKNLKK